MKRLVVLGSTGSIGRQALEVVKDTECAEITGLAAFGSNIDLLTKQIDEIVPYYVSVQDEEVRKTLSEKYPEVEFLSLEEICAADECDTVLNAISGAAGIKPTFDAVNAKKNVALANKETLVAAGQIIMPLADEKKVLVLPVDSEPSAIFQCIQGSAGRGVAGIFLTASGGPFRGKKFEELQNITVEEALKHPIWNMGRKVTVDSATLMNKGLELIEISKLFYCPPARIQIVVHPQSVVHSMIEFVDGALLAQLGVPDMRTPIQYALTYPDRLYNTFERMDFFDPKFKELTFERPDFEAFPCLKLAMDAVDGELPAVLCAADEAVVNLFLQQKCGFNDIPRIIEKTLEAYTNKVGNGDGMNLDKIFEAQEFAEQYVKSTDF